MAPALQYALQGTAGAPRPWTLKLSHSPSSCHHSASCAVWAGPPSTRHTWGGKRRAIRHFGKRLANVAIISESASDDPIRMGGTSHHGDLPGSWSGRARAEDEQGRNALTSISSPAVDSDRTTKANLILLKGDQGDCLEKLLFPWPITSHTELTYFGSIRQSCRRTSPEGMGNLRTSGQPPPGRRPVTVPGFIHRLERREHHDPARPVGHGQPQQQDLLAQSLWRRPTFSSENRHICHEQTRTPRTTRPFP
ncbi:hypothetical protein F5X68DRAFT_8822 [Plectosphaerella plurivora]|uniref:Uncharacterized protein n=1 Tax=Plectosphaerella plurivora TaxID=936078 RepID=A0A9P8VD32_9PEZI|nr:hypothetical protein F5X68DRAFT_8822 [Plectosphaerella plurivora]